MNGFLKIMAEFQKMHSCTPRKFQIFNELFFKVLSAGIDPYVIMIENYTLYCVKSDRLIG
jgi:hypothetical protein